MSDIPGVVTPELAPMLAEPVGPRRADGVWRAAWRRFRRDRVGMVSMALVFAYAVLITLTATGLVARHWQDEVAVPDAPPTFLGKRASHDLHPDRKAVSVVSRRHHRRGQSRTVDP